MLVLRFKVSASQAPVLQLSNHFISLSPQLRAATLGCRRDDGLTLGRYPRSRSISDDHRLENISYTTSDSLCYSYIHRCDSTTFQNVAEWGHLLRSSLHPTFRAQRAQWCFLQFHVRATFASAQLSFAG